MPSSLPLTPEVIEEVRRIAHLEVELEVLGGPGAVIDTAEAAASERALELGDAARIVHRALDTLDRIDRLVIQRVYFDERSFDDFAGELGLSRQRCAAIHARALRRLQHALVAQNGPDVMREG